MSDGERFIFAAMLDGDDDADDVQVAGLLRGPANDDGDAALERVAHLVADLLQPLSGEQRARLSFRVGEILQQSASR